MDAVKDSVAVLDATGQKIKGKKIIDGRLASYLGVDCFYMPRIIFWRCAGFHFHIAMYAQVSSVDVCSIENFDLDRYLRCGVTCPDCHKPACTRLVLLQYAKMVIWTIFRGNGGFIMEKAIVTAS